LDYLELASKARHACFSVFCAARFCDIFTVNRRYFLLCIYVSMSYVSNYPPEDVRTLILVLLTVLSTVFVELTSPIFLLLSSIFHVLVSFNVCF